jgi:hypothetical protein
MSPFRRLSLHIIYPAIFNYMPFTVYSRHVKTFPLFLETFRGNV